ncbi:hypothetical protein Ciccas_005534 [Cichlidogyrus casuarinus]|uniref:Malignant fibrous histiocytoma-amplified sequence 1 homolog n=1 Tax=Cichlidogyrus casuarinus TaxID=1844966 RepID=A0ABD2Q9D9_9PLAT
MSLASIPKHLAGKALRNDDFFLESKHRKRKDSQQTNMGFYAMTRHSRSWILCHLVHREEDSPLKSLEITAECSHSLDQLKDWDNKIYLNLLDLDHASTDLLQSCAKFLSKLDLTNLSIEVIPRELIVKLSPHLNELILKKNKLTTSSLVLAQTYTDEGLRCWLRNVHTLDLTGNKLTANIPPTLLSHMPRLQNLLAERNAFSSLAGINQAKSLKIIVFNRNCLVEISRDLYSLKNIEQIYVSRNQIKKPLSGIGIKALTYLKLIDISHNQLNSLPGDLFQLPKLEIVQASHNCIENLPNIQVRDNRPKIKLINLSFNLIQKFTHTLLTSAEQVELNNNRIRFIPVNMLRKFSKIMQLKRISASVLFKVNLKDNPMRWPPKTVTDLGMEAIMLFFQEASIDSTSCMGIKSLFLGAPSSGKTSLSLSLLEGQRIVVDLSAFNTKDDALSDDQMFQERIGHYLKVIVQRNNHVVLVLIASKCDLLTAKKTQEISQQLHKKIQDFLVDRIRKLTEEVYKIEALPNISASMAEHYKHLTELHRTWKVNLYPKPIITSSNYEGEDFVEMQKTLCEAFFKIALEAPKVAPFCLKSIPNSWLELEVYCEEVAARSESSAIWSQKDFYSVLTEKLHVASNNVEPVATFLSDSGRAIIPHTIVWDPENSLKNTDGDRGRQCMDRIVVLAPKTLFEVLRLIFNSRLLEFLKNDAGVKTPLCFREDILRRMHAATGTLAKRVYDQCIDRLVSGTGIMMSELWIALSDYKKLKVSGPDIRTGRNLIILLWQWFEIAYPVAQKKMALEFNSETCQITLPPSPILLAKLCQIVALADEDEATMYASMKAEYSDFIGSQGLPALCFPALIKDKSQLESRACAVGQLWRKALSDGPYPISLIYRLPDGIPVGLFDRLVIRCNWPDFYQFHLLSHWQDGALFFNSEYKIALKLETVCGSEGTEQMIIFDFRALEKRKFIKKQNAETASAKKKPREQAGSKASKKSDFTRPEQVKCGSRKKHWPIDIGILWRLIIRLIEGFEELLNEYRGLWFRRVTKCPKCNELTFPGEWMSPSEVQSVHHRKCLGCGFRVASEMLAPPKAGQQSWFSIYFYIFLTRV